MWFQNRRMKDKRQRMAVAWPYGIADPNLYAYIMNAAASLSQYPYAAALPNASPLNYYASLGLQRAAAAYSPYGGGMQSPLRAPPPPPPRSDLMSNTLLRAPTLPQVDPHSSPNAAAAAAAAIAAAASCSLHHPRATHAGAAHHPGGPLLAPHLLAHHGPSPGVAAAPVCTSGEPCNCHMYYGAVAPTSLATPTPLLATPLHSTPSTPTQPTLFQPYKTDVERA